MGVGTHLDARAHVVLRGGLELHPEPSLAAKHRVHAALQPVRLAVSVSCGRGRGGGG
jgi:hypothetical protein